MFLRKHFFSKHLSNNSATSGFVWENFDFESCNNHEEARYIWAFCTMLCFALGFPASIAILWEMFKTHRRGTPFTPNSFLTLNLSTMDAVFLASIPPGMLNHFILKSWWIEAIWNGLYALNTCGRPLLMACICLDCYLAVVHPVTYHKRKSLTPRFVMVGVVWTLTVASGIGYFLFYKLFISIIATMPFMIAVVVIAICDSFILHALAKSGPGRNNIHMQKQRAIHTLINSLLMTVFSYFPPILLVTIGKSLFSNFNFLVCAVVIPITVTSTSGSAIMPILYLRNNGKLEYFGLRCCRKS